MLRLNHICCAAMLAALFTSHAAAQDPPSRVARLNYLEGNVSMQPAGLEDWTSAEINRPFTSGDSLFTDVASRAEFHLDSAVIRSGEFTNFSFLTLDDQTVQLSLTEGDLYVNLRELDVTQSFEVDSPNASVSLLRPGIYRFRIASDGSLTFVVVRQGQAEITGGGRAFSLAPGKSAALSGSVELAFDIEPAPSQDDFDVWSQTRDAREARAVSLRYLPRTVVGYEDMDGYGDWQPSDTYGAVWYPRTLAAGWAPYHNGHWAWIEPWGWTWVDDAPWGFAPFHYGRWVFVAGRWGWTPGPVMVVANHPAPVRPVYAPALVAWFGGAHFSVGVSVGSGTPAMGWVPLGAGEVYTPSYHCSPHYFNNVNVANTTVVKTVNITDVYNTVYINKTVYVQNYTHIQSPNAVSAMPQNAFASGRPVASASVALQARDIEKFQTSAATSALVAPPVAPARQALLASRAPAGPVARPAAQISARKVIVQNQPAAAPVPFAARQTYLQKHAGEMHDFSTMHQQVAPKNTPTQFAGVNSGTPAPAAKSGVVAPAAPRPAAPPIAPAAPKPAAQTTAPAGQTIAPAAPYNPPPSSVRLAVEPKAAATQPPEAKAAPKGYPEREHVNKPAAPEEHKDKPKEDPKKKEEHPKA